MSLYTNIIYSLKSTGIIQIIPLFLIFSIVFLVVDSAKVFYAEENDAVGRKLSGAFALGYALTAIADKNLMKWLLTFTPSATFVILTIVLLILAISFLVKPSEIPGWMRGLVILIIIGVLVAMAAEGYGVNVGKVAISINPQWIDILLIFGILAIFFIYIVK